ncbi:hypothetical protein PENNAL_c0020G02756 [Penicillium nalgiovense]|uniref:Uncharacterized protein n=1 Tax=Penicillium nalgiovense TaxID=60175 RepID=A0A1V6YIG0_PENNA|nr:hypothetical protein PENNAL_c0020G02756 [Penicillium nalgiovense]
MRIAIAGSGAMARYICEEFPSHRLSRITQFLRWLPQSTIIYLSSTTAPESLSEKVLREQSELEWTLVSVGWLVDYVVPSKNRYPSDAGPAFPIDLRANQIIIPGIGNDPVDVTSARDLAVVLAMLANAPSWEPYQRYPSVTEVKRIGLGHILDTIQTSTDEIELLISHYQIFMPLRAGSLDPEMVQRHRRKFFAGLNFRTPEQLINEAFSNGDTIV